MNQEECVCRDENEVCDDGTDCMIVGGDDTISHGGCQNGECKVE